MEPRKTRLQSRHAEVSGFVKERGTPPTALCIVGVDEYCSIYFYYVDKKGWCIPYENLSETDLQKVDSWIKSGASYLYSDSRLLEKQLSQYIDTLVLQAGTVTVLKLKRQENVPSNSPLVL